ncbi:Cyclin, N-terminal [Dillenia turbinata]|uniref:Cyclin, N-terminal n=1 Tax=Dillenia turbinata TaxID=194707 RepID=A0AAN8ZJR4_9MAGN
MNIVVETPSTLLSHQRCGSDLVSTRKRQIAAHNELAVIDYVAQLYELAELFCLPHSLSKSRIFDYMKLQAEINDEKRPNLIDCLIDIHDNFSLEPNTPYLTVNILDRYLSMEMVPSRELRLVGITAMFIACKYEEIFAPSVGYIHNFFTYPFQFYLHLRLVLLMNKF